uniref:Uncharacterized protein n=1 Tax=Oryza brachyantha TaxID=4533 RepID=J3NA49_ORYBR
MDPPNQSDLFSLKDGNLTVAGRGGTAVLLTGVPENVTLTPFASAFDPSSFRSAIFPGDDDGVVVCAESGSMAVTATDFRRIAYVHAGDDPFRLMQEAYAAARVHLGTFRLVQEKALPPMAERFGWCTWDAFYLTVDPAGVWQGVGGRPRGGRRGSSSSTTGGRV